MIILRWIGIALVLMGIAGFFTVADDLRHKGELMGIGTVLALGVIALAVGIRRGSKSKNKSETGF